MTATHRAHVELVQLEPGAATIGSSTPCSCPGSCLGGAHGREGGIGWLLPGDGGRVLRVSRPSPRSVGRAPPIPARAARLAGWSTPGGCGGCGSGPGRHDGAAASRCSPRCCSGPCWRRALRVLARRGPTGTRPADRAGRRRARRRRAGRGRDRGDARPGRPASARCGPRARDTPPRWTRRSPGRRDRRRPPPRPRPTAATGAATMDALRRSVAAAGARRPGSVALAADRPGGAGGFGRGLLRDLRGGAGVSPR